MRKARPSQISNRWAQSAADHDQDGVREALAALRKWNTDNPEPSNRITIKPASIQRRVKEMRLSKEQRFLKALPRSMRPAARSDLAEVAD